MSRHTFRRGCQRFAIPKNCGNLTLEGPSFELSEMSVRLSRAQVVVPMRCGERGATGTRSKSKAPDARPCSTFLTVRTDSGTISRICLNHVYLQVSIQVYSKDNYIELVSRMMVEDRWAGEACSPVGSLDRRPHVAASPSPLFRAVSSPLQHSRRERVVQWKELLALPCFQPVSSPALRAQAASSRPPRSRERARQIGIRQLPSRGRRMRVDRMAELPMMRIRGGLP